jgi:hypothetical protein
MTRVGVFAALVGAVVGLHGRAALDGCWTGSTTNGSNPGLNIMTMCMDADDDVGLTVYFPNTPIGEPPTTCLARGRRSEAQGNAFRILTDEGLCRNGGTMGVYDFHCSLEADEALSCDHIVRSGDNVNVRLEKLTR